MVSRLEQQLMLFRCLPRRIGGLTPAKLDIAFLLLMPCSCKALARIRSSAAVNSPVVDVDVEEETENDCEVSTTGVLELDETVDGEGWFPIVELSSFFARPIAGEEKGGKGNGD